MEPTALPVLLERALASGRLHSAYLISGQSTAALYTVPLSLISFLSIAFIL